MPEGPEVEVALRQLKSVLTGSVISASKSYHDRFLKLPTGEVIVRVWRHGKWIHMLLGNQSVLRINFGMSGRLVVGGRKPKYTRWAARLVGYSTAILRFVDPRSFGRLELWTGRPAGLLADPTSPARGVPLARLGPDLMCSYVCSLDTGRRRALWMKALDTSLPIKLALMDQTRLAGLGNIYANELCWYGKVHPATPASHINRKQLDAMAAIAPEMLNNAVRLGGTSFGDANTYRDSRGVEGNFASRLRVYGKAGQLCQCGVKIQRLELSGRGTFFCPRCQPIS